MKMPDPNCSLAEYEALLRLDLTSFILRCFMHLNPQTDYQPNWHIEVMTAKLRACFEGKIKRLIINVPPRSLKSICASIALPAWWLGHQPSASILCASYGQDLANKLSMDCRSVMMSDWYQALFPTRVSPDKRALAEFTTTAQGFRMATSVGGVLTGRGADLIIIDDPLKPDEAISGTQRQTVNSWYDHTLYSRLNDKKKGCIILIMQRLHLDDLVGHLCEQESWEVLSFPAIAPEDEVHEIETPLGPRHYERRVGDLLHPARESLETLAGIRRTLGEYNFAGQYLQSPVPAGGGLVKAEWFKNFATSDLLAPFDAIIQSWDTANKETELADYSVGTTWGVKNANIYLLHVFRKRLNYPDLKRAAIEQNRLWSPSIILIEDCASGTQLIQELLQAGVSNVKGVKPENDKTMRMQAQTARIENGFVHLPVEAHWRAEYVQEMISFPASKYSDQVDSTSQALAWITFSGAEPGMIGFARMEMERLGLVLPDAGSRGTY